MDGDLSWSMTRNPLRLGSMASSTTRSGADALAAFTAASPSGAVDTSAPDSVNAIRMALRISGSSSTMSMDLPVNVTFAPSPDSF